MAIGFLLLYGIRMTFKPWQQASNVTDSGQNKIATNECRRQPTPITLIRVKCTMITKIVLLLSCWTTL